MASTTTKWIIGGVAVVGLLLLYAEGKDRNSTNETSTSRSCTVRVTTDSLPVRSGPNSDDPVVETLVEGSVVLAERTTSGDFRQLGPDRWAENRHLNPMPGSDCG